MTWDEKVEKYGQPEKGKLYRCLVKQYGTGNEVVCNLKCAREDDVFWRTEDGSEINEWNWDVISWNLNPENPSDGEG